ncbi:MAG TPA: hypothetical protein VI751_09485 [Actinomycetota bacterium]
MTASWRAAVLVAACQQIGFSEHGGEPSRGDPTRRGIPKLDR